MNEELKGGKRGIFVTVVMLTKKEVSTKMNTRETSDVIACTNKKRCKSFGHSLPKYDEALTLTVQASDVRSHRSTHVGVNAPSCMDHQHMTVLQPCPDKSEGKRGASVRGSEVG